MNENTGQDWPSWIVAGMAVAGALGMGIKWMWGRLTGSVSRAHFQKYLEGRDAISEAQYKELSGKLTTQGEKLARIEGALEARGLL